MYKHLVVDVTVTNARENSYVHVVEAPLPLPTYRMMGAQQAKLDVDIRTSPSIGTLSNYYAQD
jgi:hypothetical protein